jgi:tripartite-type tricarboxylate transporter receptor subunit TctC
MIFFSKSRLQSRSLRDTDRDHAGSGQGKALIRFALAIAAFTVTDLFVVKPLMAQEVFPSRPITLIIPLSPGSQMDVLGRALAESLSKTASQPVVVQNRDGAAMVLGMDATAKARPDGYTIAFGPESPLTVAPHLFATLPYKVTDFELVCRTNLANMAVVVGPQSPFKSFDDVVSAARRAPGKLTYGTAGIGSPPHLLMEAVAAQLGIQLNHVPFRVISDLSVQTMNGSVDFTVTVPFTLVVNGPRGMRGLAQTGTSTIAELPPMPLIRDIVGKDSPVSNYGVGGLGLYAPKGIRTETLAWLRTACKAASESVGFVSASARTYTPLGYADGPEFQRAMQGTSSVTEGVIRRLDIKLQ